MRNRTSRVFKHFWFKSFKYITTTTTITSRISTTTTACWRHVYSLIAWSFFYVRSLIFFVCPSLHPFFSLLCYKNRIFFATTCLFAIGRNDRIWGVQPTLLDRLSSAQPLINSRVYFTISLLRLTVMASNVFVSSNSSHIIC